MPVSDELKRLCHRRLCLRLVEPEDADFIHGLRMDPAYNAHLSAVDGTAADQRAWISRYKEREAAGRELYYVIERRDGTPCGLVRLYGIGTDGFTWGSWILNRDKPAGAALESAVLSFGVGFEKLGLHRKQASGQNIWNCEVTGPQESRRLHGYLLTSPDTLFHEIPPNNPYLRLANAEAQRDDSAFHAKNDDEQE